MLGIMLSLLLQLYICHSNSSTLFCVNRWLVVSVWLCFQVHWEQKIVILAFELELRRKVLITVGFSNHHYKYMGLSFQFQSKAM